ncbi:conserved hypothetical protein [delta proteobacterium NaphS2]|nr:conserved hypothetical protein [delta proteobacterium NaphS2]
MIFSYIRSYSFHGYRIESERGQSAGGGFLPIRCIGMVMQFNAHIDENNPEYT